MMRRLLLVAGTIAVVTAAHAQHYVPTPGDSLHPRLRYPDSLISANDRCAVSGARLNPKARPVYVNGTPIGFC
jgi:hypothetical protein